MCYLPFLWNCLWNLLAISWVKIVFFKLDHHNMLLLYKKEQHEQQCSSKILFFSSTEESQSHRFGASWEVNYTFIKFLGWMCSLESRLNFRVLTCFWYEITGRPYRLHMCGRKPLVVFPWCHESFQLSCTCIAHALWGVGKIEPGVWLLQHPSHEGKPPFPLDVPRSHQHSCSFQDISC